MTLMLKNYAADSWIGSTGNTAAIRSALTGADIARTGSDGLDFAAMIDHARTVGGPALRAMTFHQRAHMLKALATAIMARKEELYALSASTGATRKDGWIDIEGGAGTLFTMSSKGRRELPDDVVLVDGEIEGIGRAGTFIGQHIYTSLQGVAVHINAFNFPVWGMLEKLGPTLLAGVPAIIKPGTATAHVTEAAVRIMVEAGVLPPGALQLIVGSVGDLLDHLTCQDVVSFTGSAATAMKLQSHPVIARESVRFIAERDSLNATVLGPDAGPGTPEFDLFIAEVVQEMTTKAGQKCTAIRRAFVPAAWLDAAEDALKARLAKVVVGDPSVDGVTMGALAGQGQLADVRAQARKIGSQARLVFGDYDHVEPLGAGAGQGAFITPLLFRADDPWTSALVHDVEAFGPVATLMPYRDLADAIALANRGLGSLVVSIFTHDPAVARDFVIGVGAWHGRIVLIDRDSAAESTGHGSPLPMLIHGAPAAPVAARKWAACAGSSTTCSAPRFRAARGSSARSSTAGSPAPRVTTTARTPFACASTSSPSATASTASRAPSRSRISSISPSSPATLSTPTWTRRRRPRTPSSPAASRTATSSCRSPRACSSTPPRAPCWPTPGSTPCAS
jgi:oxepin-CoA hydrolase/3-oxo-5,6-dehydrosuberyl-CoA semialdehyde dehydrogenase